MTKAERDFETSIVDGRDAMGLESDREQAAAYGREAVKIMILAEDDDEDLTDYLDNIRLHARIAARFAARAL